MPHRTAIFFNSGVHITQQYLSISANQDTVLGELKSKAEWNVTSMSAHRAWEWQATLNEGKVNCVRVAWTYRKHKVIHVTVVEDCQWGRIQGKYTWLILIPHTRPSDPKTEICTVKSQVRTKCLKHYWLWTMAIVNSSFCSLPYEVHWVLWRVYWYKLNVPFPLRDPLILIFPCHHISLPRLSHHTSSELRNYIWHSVPLPCYEEE